MFKKHKKLLAQYIALEKLILYRSYAKGTAHKDSDIDVAVIVDAISRDYFSTKPLLSKIRREVENRIEPVFIEKAHNESGFLSEIIKND